ncbi:MAG: hypothetical protein ONB44_07630 [candidate division KSB1 bacterium]|nr:hypothetical protein [candidate division KSB1 bacterium]MDZ7301997.1 hypothetical protein [candidate division KSB1 bacterium]MDZ7310179.1 hypothetical protein [candidate division KSB1 bacterium]
MTAAFLWELLRRIFVKFFKTSFDVVIFIGLVAITIWFNLRFEKPASSEDQVLLQNFIEWYAIFYAFALGLIVGHAWNKHNTINCTIDHEADALALLLQTGRMAHNKILSTNLCDAVESYVRYVRKARYKDRRTKEEAQEEMNKIHGCIEQMINSSEVQESLKPELIQQYNKFHDARSDRFDLIKQEIKFPIWMNLIVFSLVWLWGFFWLKIESKQLSNYILGITTFSIAYLFSLARDLDNPKSGFWRMNFEPFDSFDVKAV